MVAKLLQEHPWYNPVRAAGRHCDRSANRTLLSSTGYSQKILETTQRSVHKKMGE